MEKNYIITLEDDKEYALVGKLELDNKTYVYLIDIHDYNNFIFGELTDNKVIKVTDNELLNKLIINFAKMKGKDI